MQPAVAPLPSAPLPASIVGARYRLLDEIGRGGMGVVYRAADRLSSETVTVKLAHAGEGATQGSPLPEDVLRSLAHEFGILASLRHPNVIRVHDYGFDPLHGPYLVMEHRPDADTLLPAASGAALETKIDLLVELLRALAYLHRRGIVHRDVKPENVLVAEGRVRVVDFGVSIPYGEDAFDLAGTGPYLAPELLMGGAANVRSDLWALGVVAAELLGGRHPFEPPDMLAKVLHRAPDLAGVPAPFAPVVARLLEKDPARRFGSATEAAEALSAAAPHRIAVETVETRESFLQASRFVGRDRELGDLQRALGPVAQGGAGGVWLLGGESGVGKSRLADEAAIGALVSGMRVLRGQARAEAASPFDVWRPVLRGFCLTASPTESEATALGTILPDLGALLGRAVSPLPAAEEGTALDRILVAVEDLIGRERTPTLVILEDLQWAGSESLRLLAWLGRAVARTPVVLLGTFRDDEAPRLADAVGDAHLVKLGRLSRDAVGELSRAIVGSTAADDRLVDGLVSATEGNPFFLVETLRAIANEVGRLDALGAEHLRPEVPAEGVRRVLERRLARLAPETREVLMLAALAGRELDPAVIARACGARDLDAHIHAAAELSVLEARGGAVVFAHDKLREALQRELPDGRRAQAHARLGAAIEATHGERPEQLPALAYHFDRAGDEPRSLRYAELAGARALAAGAFSEAVPLLERARALAERRGAPREQRFRLDVHLTEAHYQLGDLDAARRHGEESLRHVGEEIPKGALALAWVTAREAAIRAGQAWGLAGRPALGAEDLARLGRVLIILSECYVFAVETGRFALAALRLTNRTAPAGPSSALARGFQDLGMLAMTTPFKRTAQRWVDRAVEMARTHGAENDLAFIRSRAGVLHITTAEWAEAERQIRAAEEAATNRGDRRLLDENEILLGAVLLCQARYGEAFAQFQRTAEASRRSGTAQVARWSELGLADTANRCGRHEEALPIYDRVLARGGLFSTERVWAHGMRALARLRAGDRTGAREDALAVVAVVDETPALAYWTQWGLHATGTVLLELCPPEGPDAPARKAVLHATVLAAVAGLARPAAALLQGELARKHGHLGLARRRFERAAALARTSGMPFEGALAEAALARVEPSPGDRETRLRRALRELDALGCAGEAAVIRAELGAR